MLTSIQNEAYVIKDNGKGWVFLNYKYRDKKVIYKKTVGKVTDWRRDIFLQFAKEFKVSNETRKFVTSARLKVFIAVLPTVKDVRDALRLKDIVMELGVEELAFWNWKITVTRKNTVRSFRAMYEV